jgi:phosphatidylglycerophosphate synthase
MDLAKIVLLKNLNYSNILLLLNIITMTVISKIPMNERCESDKLLYVLVQNSLSFWHDINFTPNMITTLGAISSYLSLKYYYKGNKKYSILFLLLRAYFDYTDGALARVYNQISKFGDYYDHIVDSVFLIVLNIIIYNKFKNKNRSILILSILNIFSWNMLSIFGCDEIKYNKLDESDCLSLTAKMCNKALYEKHAKTFCNGNIYILIMIIMMFDN